MEFSQPPRSACGRAERGCKVYFTSEDGDVFVVKAGPKYELLATNAIGEVWMASPAISDGMIFVRAEHHVFAIGQRPTAAK